MSEDFIYENINWIIDTCVDYHLPITNTKAELLKYLKNSFYQNYDHYKNKDYGSINNVAGYVVIYTTEEYIRQIYLKFNKIYGFGNEKSIYYINEFLQNDMWKQYENQH